MEYLSRGTLQSLGYTTEEFLGHMEQWHQMMHPDDVPGFVANQQSLFATQAGCTTRYRLKHATTGEYSWFEDTAVPVLDNNRSVTGVAGVIRSIESPKGITSDWGMAATAVDALLDAIPDAVLFTDNAGLILKANVAVERLLGRDVSGLQGQPVEILLPERFRTGRFLNTDSSRAPYVRGMGSGQMVALHDDGREVPVDIIIRSAVGKQDQRLVILKDASESRKAQQGLAYLSSIVKSTDESIIGTNLEGLVVAWNRGAERLFGYTEKEALGKHLTMIYPKELHQEGLENIRRVNQGQRPSRYESRRQRKDGSTFDVSVVVSPVEDGLGNILGMSSMCRDITERNRASAALRLAKQAAETASQAKSEFLANMSHELRTPLGGVIGLTDLLLDSEPSEEARECLPMIKESAQSLLAILSDILEVAKIQSGKYVVEAKPFGLRELLRNTAGDFEAEAQAKGLKLSWSIDPKVRSMLLGDPNCIGQVLSNLVANAIKFTPAGAVTITVKCSAADPATLTFCVKDTGVGVPPNKQRDIFEPFTQVDASHRREFGGTGLGLAICAQLVDIMGGKIWLESDGRTGSSFFFMLQLPGTGEPDTSEGIGPAPHGVERRLAERLPVRQPVLIRLLDSPGATPFSGQTVNSSQTGLRIQTSHPLRVGALVQIELHRQLVTGEVRYCIAAGDCFYSGIAQQ